MTFDSLDAWWWPYVFILLAGWLPTAMWRYLGVYFAGGLHENAEILVLVRALATALVASVIAKMVLYPDGALATTPTLLRILAAGLGFTAYVISGRRVWVGVLSGEVILLLWMHLGNAATS
jgi:Branched-chain amino acid transport protein (AzlD)